MMNNKISIAEEILQTYYKIYTNADNAKILYMDDVLTAMKEFAQLHVDAALKAASEKVKMETPDENRCKNCYGTSGVIDKESILTAYKDQIK